MAEVLSQSQIDALLSSVMQQGFSDQNTKVAEPDKKYRKYDFYSPKKFTKDRLKFLSSIYENYARMISSRLNALLRINSEVEVVNVEEQRYYEFSNALSDNDVLTIVKASLPDDSENDPIIMHISTQLMLSMIDRRLGSGDNDIENIPLDYSYTDLELSLYSNIVNYIIRSMKDGWANYLEVDFEMQRVEINPSLMQNISPDETIVIIVMDVSFSSVKGQINICLPVNLLESIFAVFDKRMMMAGKGSNKDEDLPDEIMASIKSSMLEVTAQLGKAQVFLRDIYGLHVGDVINLNKPKDSEVALYIGEKPWFKGKLGVQNKNMAVKISGLYESI
jgi:flagellar motor switch protein FliM